MNKALNIGAIILGACFVLLAVLYWMVPAGSLPHVLPGYTAGSSTIHFKHGVASLLLGLGLFAFVWFATGPKNTTTE